MSYFTGMEIGLELVKRPAKGHGRTRCSAQLDSRAHARDLCFIPPDWHVLAALGSWSAFACPASESCILSLGHPGDSPIPSAWWWCPGVSPPLSSRNLCSIVLHCPAGLGPPCHPRSLQASCTVPGTPQGLYHLACSGFKGESHPR